MSRISDLREAYEAEVARPWQDGISGGERVWMLVYPPDLERTIRGSMDQFRIATESARHGWHVIDISDELGRWIADHEYAEAFFERPRNLTAAVLEQFTEQLTSMVREQIEAQPPDAVVALLGVGSLFPFVRASAVIKDVDESIRGRLLVFFPGRNDPNSHAFRLLDARDGFSYRARVIDPNKER